MPTEHVSTYSTILKTTIVPLAALAWTSLLTCGESQHCILLNSICQQSYGWGNLHSADTACSCSCTACLWANQIQLICGGCGLFSQNKTFHKAVTWALTHPFWCAGPRKALSWDAESWAGSTSSLYDKQSCSTTSEPSNVSAMAPAQPGWWDRFFAPGSLGSRWQQWGAGVKAGARCWLWCVVFVQCLEPTGRGVGACRAVACDGLSTMRMALPCSTSCPCFGWEGRQKTVRGTSVRSLALVIHGRSALGYCFTSSPTTGFLIKLKCPSAGAPGPVAGRGDSGSLGHRQSVAACYPR